MSRDSDSLALFLLSTPYPYPTIMPLVLTSNPADLKTQSGRETRFRRQRFLTERTSPSFILRHRTRLGTMLTGAVEH